MGLSIRFSRLSSDEARETAAQKNAFRRVLSDSGPRAWHRRGTDDGGAGTALESSIGSKPATRLINLIGQTDLLMLMGVLSHCRALVANDSGALHVAAAMGIPVTAIYGPTDERYSLPLTSSTSSPESVHAIRLLNRGGFKVVIVTSQAGVANGIVTEEFLAQAHDAIARKVAAAGGQIDGFYYCPHLPTAAVEKYRTECECRKPKPGMI